VQSCRGRAALVYAKSQPTFLKFAQLSVISYSYRENKR
jgi:hypothetical protein